MAATTDGGRAEPRQRAQPRQRQGQQVAGICFKPVLANMERDDRIGICCDDIDTGSDELVMHITHELWCFHQ